MLVTPGEVLILLFNLQYQIQKLSRMVYLQLTIPAPRDRSIICTFHVILKILSHIILPLQKGEQRLFLRKVRVGERMKICNGC